MEWIVTALGALVIVAVVRDIFHQIFHPSGQGTLSWAVMRAAWWLSRRGGRRLGMLAGPLALLAAIGTWTALLVLGWTLVYWPHLPEAFSYGSTLQPSARNDFLDALYLSLVTGATLGYGDVTPSAGWLRVAAPLEALVGFGLLTAAVTWVLQVYPALTRRRSLSLRLATLRRGAPAHAVGRLDSPMAAGLLESLAQQLVVARVDLTQYSESYFFRDTNPDLALPATVGHLLELCQAGHSSAREDVRLAAQHLQEAVDDVAAFLDLQFLRSGGSTREVLEAYAADHGHEFADAP